MKMTIPSRPAPPPPTQQWPQRQQSLSYSNEGGKIASQSNIKLPPPSTSTKSYQTKYASTSTISMYSNPSNARKSPVSKTCYAPVQNYNNDPFEITPRNVHNHNAQKKIPPPRPPPPKKDLNYGSTDTMLKKPGPPQSVSTISNIFGKKKGYKKSFVKQQFPSNRLPPLSNASLKEKQNYQARPYAFVPPLIRNNNEAELINFDSPPSSPSLKKSNSDGFSMDSLSSDSNFSSPKNESATLSESGFEDDFTSPADPWETLTSDPFSDNSSQFTNIYQPVRNLNTIGAIKGDDILSNGKSLLPPIATLTTPTIIKPKTSQNSKGIAPKPPNFMKEEENNSFNLYTDSPPMPNCPPPPPPPEILNVSNQELELDSEIIDPSEPSYGIALYDFEGVEEGDLSFKANEKVYLLQKMNEEWYFGRNKRGCEGIFPSNHIEIKRPLEENEATSSATGSRKNSKFIQDTYKARSLYTFEAEVSEDLSLSENDVVTVLYRINDDWLYGEKGDRRGQFPANFVEFISK